jgi:DNA primase
VMVVEGYMDVIALFQHGITYAVATLGTATTAQHLQRLFRYTAEIIFCFDGDEAGRTAAWRALQVIFPLMQDNLQIRFLFLPDEEDPDSLVRKEGKEAFEKRLTNARTLSAFFFQTLSSACDLNTMEGRARLAARALSHIKQLPSELYQSLLLDELAKRSRIDINELKQQMRSDDPIGSGSREATQKPPLKTPMRLALALTLQHPTLVPYIDKSLLNNELVKNLAGYPFLLALVEIILQHPHITTGALMEYWRGKPEEGLLAKLTHFEHHIPDTGIKEEYLGAFRQLIQLGIDEKISSFMSKAEEGTLSNEEKIALSELIIQKKKLNSS